MFKNHINCLVLEIETVEFIDELPPADLFFRQRDIKESVEKLPLRHLAFLFRGDF